MNENEQATAKNGPKKTEMEQEAFLKAYKASFGNVSVACQAVGIGRTKFYHWMKKDSEFKDRVAEIEPEDDFLDFVENSLHKKIRDGDTTAIIFTLKTKGKKRGYVERQEITGAEGGPLSISAILADIQ